MCSIYDYAPDDYDRSPKRESYPTPQNLRDRIEKLEERVQRLENRNRPLKRNLRSPYDCGSK